MHAASVGRAMPLVPPPSLAHRPATITCGGCGDRSSAEAGAPRRLARRWPHGAAATHRRPAPGPATPATTSPRERSARTIDRNDPADENGTRRWPCRAPASNLGRPRRQTPDAGLCPGKPRRRADRPGWRHGPAAASAYAVTPANRDGHDQRSPSATRLACQQPHPAGCLHLAARTPWRLPHAGRPRQKAPAAPACAGAVLAYDAEPGRQLYASPTSD